MNVRTSSGQKSRDARPTEAPESLVLAFDDNRLLAPLFGEHTYDVAERIVGLTPDEIADLMAAGVLA